MKQDKTVANYFAGRDQFVKQVGIRSKGDKRRKPQRKIGNSKRTKRSKEEVMCIRDAAANKSLKCPICIKVLDNKHYLEPHGCSTPTTINCKKEFKTTGRSTQGTPIMKEDKVVANYFTGRDQFVNGMYQSF
jgi:hypothetical protein